MIAILADEAQLPRATAVWGRENRALPAPGRAALSWLTLARLLGWEAEVHYPGDDAALGAAVRCAVIARDPESLGAAEAEALAARLEREPMLLVVPAPPPGSPLAGLAGAAASGERVVTDRVRWHGPGGEREWRTWPTLTIRAIEAGGPAAPWATAGDAPLVVAREAGKGVVATLAAHPAELADAAPSGSGLLKHLLTRGTPGEADWLELEGWVVTRLDNLGSSSSAHLDGWAHRSLAEAELEAVGRDLAAREARITIGWVPGWVDDGDPARGELRVDGEPVERVPGRVHPSPLVTYGSAEAAQDNPAALRGVGALRRAGAAALELQGHTHLRPLYADRGGGPYAAWAAAPNRHDGVGWYRELEGLEPPPGEPGPVAAGLELFARHLGGPPEALLCPGLACSPPATETAAAAGLDLVAAETLALRVGERLAWCDHVPTPYADDAGGHWLESGLPVIAHLYDRDLVLGGTGWLAERLDEWSARGATRFADMRELAAALDGGRP